MYEFYRCTLIISCRFICVFAVLINKVSLQETVHREGVIGGSVLLPCSSTKHDLKLQDTDVSWRHNDSEIVYDIVKGEDSVAGQDPRYKNRVETFPLEYERGNFSIKLTDLTHTDAGEFNCLITPSDEQKTVVLIIKAGKENTSNQANQGPGRTMIISISALSTVIIIIIVFIAYFIIHRRKKNSDYLTDHLGAEITV